MYAHSFPFSMDEATFTSLSSNGLRSMLFLFSVESGGEQEQDWRREWNGMTGEKGEIEKKRTLGNVERH